jgi:hypothetical protein
MAEHISYAMRNTDAVNSLIWFNAPSALKDWSFLAIEWIMIGGFLLALTHALRYRRETGSPSALLTLLGCFLYGLLIDIASYYTVDSFWHGEFSVMFLHNRLPLYIALFYPAFMYHICMTVRRMNLSPLTEAISTGFYAGISYLIFDNLGPLMGWWIWDRNNPTNLPFLSSVPMTSYQWFFFFTTAFTLISRKVCWDWVEARRKPAHVYIGMAVLPIATCVLGTLMFIPHNILVMNGLYTVDSFTYAIVFTAAGFIFLFNFKRPAVARDKLLMVFPLVWVVGQLYIYAAKFELFFAVTPQGLSAAGLAAGNLIAAVVAMIVSAAITLCLHPIDARPIEAR